MKKILYLLSFFMCAISANAKTDTVFVEYSYNGKKISLNDDFEIYFVIIDSTQKIIIKPEIIKNTFIIPDLIKNSCGFIVFRYQKTTIGLGFNNFYYTQSMRWEIGFNKKSHINQSETGHVINDKINAVVHIAFHPLEQGEGVVTTISIVDIKRYLKESKELIE